MQQLKDTAEGKLEPAEADRLVQLEATIQAGVQFQADPAAGRRGQPSGGERKMIRFEIEAILKAFTSGTLRPRSVPRTGAA